MSVTINAEDRGFTLGDGVFDTALALNGILFARARHIERLLASARHIGIALEQETVEAQIDACLPPEPAIIRTTITRGTAARGLWPGSADKPTVLVSCAPWNPALPGQPARLVTAGGRRNEFSPTANIKALGYLDHVLAAREAAAAGVDDALILNTRGRVACTTIANIFVLRCGQLVTPPLTDGCLPGIMRTLVMEAAAQLGIAVEERSLEPAELTGARAVFLTNSVRFIRPVTELDGLPLPHDQTLFSDLMQHLAERVESECRVRAPFTRLDQAPSSRT